MYETLGLFKISIYLVKSWMTSPSWTYAPASTYQQYIEYKNQLRLFGTALWYFWQEFLQNPLTKLHKKIIKKNQQDLMGVITVYY